MTDINRDTFNCDNKVTLKHDREARLIILAVIGIVVTAVVFGMRNNDNLSSSSNLSAYDVIQLALTSVNNYNTICKGVAPELSNGAIQDAATMYRSLGATDNDPAAKDHLSAITKVGLRDEFCQRIYKSLTSSNEEAWKNVLQKWKLP
jgi:hypothetical protein